MKISQIVDKIDDFQIYVPAFQREYVWKREHAKKLIGSLLKDYPTGTMLTWDTTNPPELKGPRKYNKDQGAVKIILDGQQRITTLYMLIKGVIPPYYSKVDIQHDVRGLYVNLETLELQYYKKNIMMNDPLWVDITDIFKKIVKPNAVVRSMREKNKEVSEDLFDLIIENISKIQKIPDYDFIEQTIPITANVKEAIDVFYIVNASGVSLTDAELALAQISGYWPQARDLFKAKLKELSDKGFVFKLDFIVYILLAILYNSGSDMKKLHNSDNHEALIKAWEKLDKYTLDYVMNIMQRHAFVDHTKEINSVYALVPIIAYCYKNDNKLTQNGILKMIKWFYYSQIRQRYISQLPQKLDQDVRTIANSDNPFDDLLNTIKAERPLEISPGEFEGAGVSVPLWSLMRWYFKSKDAICLTTGLSIRHPMGKSYSLEWDHIFAFAKLKAIGYGRENRVKYSLAQEITNRVVLTATANRSKSDELAENYLKSVQLAYPQALKLQCIPEDEALWKIENFEDFLSRRRTILANELNSFLNNLAITIETTIETPIEDIIALGESSELEFKSTLRWNMHIGSVDKKMEESIVRTIAAFSNTEGGTLIIGVDDDSNVLGLDNDYTSLRGNKDEFELHLRNICNNYFGKAFTTAISISFPHTEDTEICRVEVNRGSKPVYVKFNEASEKLFVRNGNSTNELGTSEVSDYVNNHFYL